jgi:hypothetical protein
MPKLTPTDWRTPAMRTVGMTREEYFRLRRDP